MISLALFGRTYADIYREYFDKHGTCPVEAGLIGHLADNECAHGSLATDAKPACSCFPKPKKKKR